MLQAQSLSPTVVACSGGQGTLGGALVEWTVGEPVVATFDVGGTRLTQGFHQAEVVRLHLNLRAFLQGPYAEAAGTMNDGLRSQGLLPLQEPYTALGHSLVGGGGESTAPAVLAATGNNAVVDWVLLELRDKDDLATVLASRCALLQRDGDVVDTDGTSPVTFTAPADEYYVAVVHRNHMSVATALPLVLGAVPLQVDLTNGSTATFGTEAQQLQNGTHLLWAGDVWRDEMLKYTGADNDRDPILTYIGGSVPTNTVQGYAFQDVNMDGTVKYTGLDNDRDIILQNVGGQVPTAVRYGGLY
jgi:hypothetical protein